MAECGDRYRALAITASGYTPDNPWGVALIISDYGEWRDLAEKLVSLVNVHMATLQAIESKQAKGMPEFLRLSSEWSVLLAHYEALPEFIFVVSETKTRKAIAVVTEALCVLERVDEVIEHYGEEPPGVPSPGRDPAPKPPSGGTLAQGFGTVVVLGVVGLVAYYFFMKGVRD